MKNKEQFYTLTGYRNNEEHELSYAMEDYLEMIYRLSLVSDNVRVGAVSRSLNVKPSSSSKMIKSLSLMEYVDFKKYGTIYLTEKGKASAEYLMFRHNVLFDFLCLLNSTDNELEQVEKIEHFIDKKTILNLKALTEKLKDDNS